MSLFWKRILIVVPIVIVVFIAIAATPLVRFLIVGMPPQQVGSVSTVVAKTQTWQPGIDIVGSLRAVQGADLATEVAGIVDELHAPGMDVAPGTILMRLRAGDDLARLATLQAQAQLADANFERDQKQFQANLIARQQFDATASAQKVAHTAVTEQQAIVEKKVVRAPFAGHLGVAQVNVGQYLAAGTPVVTLQALNPIYFDFTLPQQALNQIKIGQPLKLKVDTFPNETFDGEIAFIDPKVDPGTRNVSARAMLQNPDRRLLPGMYATGAINTGAVESHLTLPQTAIAYNPYGNLVYRVAEETKDGKKQLVVHQTFITTGDTRGDQVAVLSGISEGDVIVSAGQFKIKNGDVVTVNNTVQPTNEPNPTPLER